MQSKTSFFNKALFKKNLSRTWVVGLLYFIVLLIQLPVSFIITIANFENSYYADMKYTKKMVLYEHFSRQSASDLQCILAIIVIAITFWYLFSKRDNYMIHAFPVTRKSLFATGIASSLLVTIIPVILVAALMSLVSAVEHAGAYETIWYWAFAACVSTVLFIALSMFSVMISGQIVTAIVFYAIFNALYFLMDVAFRLTASMLMFGMGSNLDSLTTSIFTPEQFIANKCGTTIRFITDDYGNIKDYIATIDGAKYLFIYLAAAVVLFAISYIFYKTKKLETVHDFINVPFMKPVFSVGMSFFVSMVAGAMVSSMIDAAGTFSYSAKFTIAIIASLIIGIIIFYATQMMIEKTVRVFSAKKLGFCLLYTAASLAFLLCLRFDVFKVENKVPNANDIAWVGIQSNYTMVFTSEDEINTVLSLHKNFLQDKKELRDVNIKYSDVPGDYFTIKYKLKNGNKIIRMYNVVDTYSDQVSAEYVAATQPILDFLNNPTIIKEHIIGNIWNDCTVTEMYFSSYFYDSNIGDYTAESEEFYDLTKLEKYEKNNRVYEAFLKDIDEGKAFQTTFAGYSNLDESVALYNDFNFTVSNEKIPYFSDENTYWDYEWDDYDEPFYEQYIYVYLTKDCTNTLKALKEEGFYTDDEGILTYKEYNSTMGYDSDYEVYDGLDGGEDEYVDEVIYD